MLIHLPNSSVIQQQGPLYHCLPDDLQAVLNVGMINVAINIVVMLINVGVIMINIAAVINIMVM